MRMVSFIPPGALPGGKEPLSIGDATQSQSGRCRYKSSRSLPGIESRLAKSLHWPSYHTAPAIKTYLDLKYIQWVHFDSHILARSQNCEKRLLASSCLSVRLDAWNNSRSHCADFHVTWYLNIFRKSVEKMEVSLKSDKNNRYFTWRAIYIFDHISLISS